jgi:hypothetical protein
VTGDREIIDVDELFSDLGKKRKLDPSVKLIVVTHLCVLTGKCTEAAVIVTGECFAIKELIKVAHTSEVEFNGCRVEVLRDCMRPKYCSKPFLMGLIRKADPEVEIFTTFLSNQCEVS